MGFLVLAPTWSRMEACPVGELRERAAELAFQAGAFVIAVKNYSISLQLVIRAINLVQSCIDVREGERCEVPKAIRTSLYETRSVVVHLASDRRSALRSAGTDTAPLRP